jgi:nitrite reductase/ring-hydroxylating ferredoxin subunit
MRQLSNRLIFSLICLSLGGLGVVGCKKEKQNQSAVPYVPVDYTLSLSTPQAQPLNTVTGFLVVPNVGYKGLCLYRRSFDEYTAVDVACTYSPSESGHEAQPDSTGFLLDCDGCGSRWSLDGSLLNGPAATGLQPYRVAVNGDLLNVQN